MENEINTQENALERPHLKIKKKWWVIGLLLLALIVAMGMWYWTARKDNGEVRTASTSTNSRIPFNFASGKPSFKNNYKTNENVYIVELQGSSLLDYKKRISEQKQSLSPAQSQQYLNSLKNGKQNLKTEISKLYQKSGKVFSSNNVKSEYNVALNGLSLRTSPELAEKIKTIPGVKSVRRAQTVYTLAEDTKNIIGAGKLHTLTPSGEPCGGNNCVQGQGMKIAVLDTGVDLTNVSLGGDGQSEPWLASQINYPLEAGAVYTEKALSLDGNRMAYITKPNVVILKDQNGERQLKLHDEAHSVLAVYLKGNTLIYEAVTNENSPDYYFAFLYSLNLTTGVNKKYFDSIQFFKVEPIDDNTIALGYSDKQTGELTLAKMTLSDGKLTKLASKASNNLVTNQFLPIYDGKYIYDTVFNFDASGREVMSANLVGYPVTGTGATITLPVPVKGLVIDIKGDNWLINPVRTRENLEEFLNYRLYNSRTKEITSLPSYLDTPSFDFQNTYFAIYFHGVSGIIPRIAGDKVVYNPYGYEVSSIYVYDMVSKRQYELNPLNVARSFDATPEKICLTSMKGKLLCIESSRVSTIGSITSKYNSKIVGGWDITRNKNLPQDGNGHGTHTTSIAMTMAPQAKFYHYKVLDNFGWGTSADIIAGIEKSADPNGDGDTSDRMDVVSISIGGQGDADDPMARAVDALSSIGTTVVVSAGNSGPGGDSNCRSLSGGDGSAQSICSPGTARSAITVAATDKQDYLATFSSRGPALSPTSGPISKPDIAAPGVNICAASLGAVIPGLTCSTTEPKVAFSGTSMAAPAVAGAAVLIKQLNPSISPASLKTELQKFVKKLPFSQTEVGSGRLDLSTYITPQTNFTISSVVSSASYRNSDLAEGSLATIFLNNPIIDTNSCSQSSQNIYEVCFTKVTVGGKKAPVFYAGNGQINFQIPYDLYGNNGVVVTYKTTKSTEFKPAIKRVAPSMFTAGGNIPNITRANGSSVNTSNPARPGETLTLWATGLGQSDPSSFTGEKAPSSEPLARTDNTQIYLNTIEAEVSFAGKAPGYIGLDQINFTLPIVMRAGTYNIKLCRNNICSTTLPLTVK